jgi:two-component system chemotaxis sensor kinase CheA
MATKLRNISAFSGNTILGDGSVIMILDPNGVAEAVGASTQSTMHGMDHGADAADAAHVQNKTSLLVFRAGSSDSKAVPLALVTRLEEVEARKIELSNGRHLLQYRGQLMPLIRVNDQVKIKDDGTQSLLVFADGTRAMALVVDEIVDIVEDTLNIEIPSDRPGILGSAVIKGEATEIIDVGHFLPLAFADWFRGAGGTNNAPASRSLLFVEDSAFFRNMLTPVLRAAGYDVTAMGGGQEALAVVKAGKAFDIVVTDLEMPGMDGFALAEAIRGQKTMVNAPIIALSSMTSPDAIAKVRKAGFHDFVAKFDRQGLVAALKEHHDDACKAA